MAILLIIAGLVLIGVIILLLKRPGWGERSAPPGQERFRDIGPGEPKPKQPRASGPD